MSAAMLALMTALRPRDRGLDAGKASPRCNYRPVICEPRQQCCGSAVLTVQWQCRINLRPSRWFALLWRPLRLWVLMVAQGCP